MKGFRGATISQFETDFLQEIEKLTENKFYFRRKDELSFSDMYFATENNEIIELRIFKCGLLILPKSIGNLTSLKKLNLVNNELEKLPESIGNLTSLKKLYLTGNPLKHLPESIGNLTSLEEILLDWEKITHFPKSMSHLKIPEKLYLPDKNLMILPESISNLSSLRELFLSYNNLKSLPKSIRNLISLKKLLLGSNPFLVFPESIIELKRLEMIDLSNAKLKLLPESIGKFNSLKRLWLRGNKLKNLPKSIGNLTSLEELYLGSNRLSSLPESIGNFTSLKILDLSKNNLITLPESIGNLSSLEALYLGGNQLLSLPESIGNLKSLKILDLISNPLKDLPDSTENLTSKILYPSLREDVLRRLEQCDFNEIKEFLHTAESSPLGEEGIFSLFERIKSISVGSQNGDRFEVLDLLMDNLQFNYGVEFTLSEIANFRLCENERNPFLGIMNTSTYSYEEGNFEDDTIRRRYWNNKLYYNIFRGHVLSIELLCDTSPSVLFYNNLKKISSFSFLKDLNLLFFCEYKYDHIKKDIRDLDFLKRIKVYEFYKSFTQPSLRTILKK